MRSTNHKFTGLERDSESGLDHTWFRKLSSTQGRWLSVDPLGGLVDDPQSLNRYAYVGNDPANFVDPLGLSRDDYVPGYVRRREPFVGPFDIFRLALDTGTRIPVAVFGSPEYGAPNSYLGVGYVFMPTFAFWIQGPLGGTDLEPPEIPPPPQPPVTPCKTSGTPFQQAPRLHLARDYGTPQGYGSPIPAPGPATVSSARSGAPHLPPPYDFRQPPPPTNAVQVRTASGYSVTYAHVTPAVQVGTMVERGAIIGHTDASGRITGPHVHVSVRNPAGNLIDPNRYFTTCK